MVDMGYSGDKTSDEIAAMAGTGPWTPKEYSSDPDYEGAAVEETFEFFESSEEKQVMTDGGVEMGFENVPESYMERAAAVINGEYGEEDPRVADAKAHDYGGHVEGSVPDTNTRERDWSDHPSGYSSSVLAHASYAFEVIMGEPDDPLEVSESHPMDNIGQNGVTRR